MGVSSSLSLWLVDRNSPNYWDFFKYWNWNGNISSHWDSFVNRILGVVDVVLLEILLNNWLRNDFFSGNINCFGSHNIVNVSSFGDWV